MNHLKAVKITDGVYEIEDFLEKYTIDQVFTLINNLDEQEWFKEDDEYTTDFWLGKTISLSGNDLINNINNSISKLFTSYSDMSPISSISRHKIDQNMGEHRDHWILDADFVVEYGVVVYYNDNYRGGEIDYPELGISIKPKAGSLIMHAGNILNGTLPVLDDQIRYFSTAFIRSTKEKPLILNKEIFGDSDEL